MGRRRFLGWLLGNIVAGRAELDAERRRSADDAARQRGTLDLTRLARQLGYADPRSASRTLRRWHDRPP